MKKEGEPMIVFKENKHIEIRGDLNLNSPIRISMFKKKKSNI